jgi:hypothetical protein
MVLPMPAPIVAEPDAEDWSFASLGTSQRLWGPHGYHRYPAKFIPQLTRRLIDLYSERTGLVADPFLGSGTTGIEALRAGRRFWGADINPVAVLISRCKVQPLEPGRLGAAWTDLNAALANVPATRPRQLTETERVAISAVPIAVTVGRARRDYWFPTDRRAALAAILESVAALTDEPLRTFFLCAFSNILLRCSIWLSGSTKPQKDLDKIVDDPLAAFRRQVDHMLCGNNLYWNELTEAGLEPNDAAGRMAITCEDARQLPLPDGVIDLLITSPPYATCYEYMQLHQLTQLWLGEAGLLPNGDYSGRCIGSRAVAERAAVTVNHPLPLCSPTAEATLTALAVSTRGNVDDRRRDLRSVRQYFWDMALSAREMARVVRPGGRIILVIGDSLIRGVAIPTARTLSEMLAATGLHLERRIVRPLPKRRVITTRDALTGRFTATAQPTVTAYPEEDILVFLR